MMMTENERKFNREMTYLMEQMARLMEQYIMSDPEEVKRFLSVDGKGTPRESGIVLLNTYVSWQYHKEHDTTKPELATVDFALGQGDRPTVKGELWYAETDNAEWKFKLVTADDDGYYHEHDKYSALLSDKCLDVTM